VNSLFLLDTFNPRDTFDLNEKLKGDGVMGSILGRLFGRSGPDNEDDILGCDMVPSPSVLARMLDPQLADETSSLTGSPVGVGPFTTMAQAPIRDS